MKKLTSVLMIAVLMVTFLAGCGKGRKLFNRTKLSKYVEVKDYKGVEVDTSTEEFTEYYNKVLKTDVEDNDFFDDVDTVENGYTVNIDYVGKIDGVEFSGGSAKGTDLVIGSGTFISGFEEGLIGAIKGETRDVTAKFPDNYRKEELQGKEAVFTCTVNSVKKPWGEDKIYKELDFDTIDEYVADVNIRAVKQYILNAVCNKATILSYPEKEQEKVLDSMYLEYADIWKQKGVDLAAILEQNNQTVDDCKQQFLTNGVYSNFMSVGMVMYSILDTEGLEIYESTLNSQETSQPLIAEYYAVQNIVLDFLYANADIK